MPQDRVIHEKLRFIEQKAHEFWCDGQGHFVPFSQGAPERVCLLETENKIAGTIHRYCKDCYLAALKYAAKSLNRALYSIWADGEGNWLYNTDATPGARNYVLGTWAHEIWNQHWDSVVQQKYDAIAFAKTSETLK